MCCMSPFITTSIHHPHNASSTVTACDTTLMCSLCCDRRWYALSHFSPPLYWHVAAIEIELGDGGWMHPWIGDLDHDMSYQHDGSDGPDGNGDGDGDGTTTTTTTITTTMITTRGSSIIAL